MKTIILIHGFKMKPFRSMFFYKKFFLNLGYEVICINYSSGKNSLRTILDQDIAPIFNQMEHQRKNYHVIAHSMGGILGRKYTIDYKPAYLKTLITLGSPHHGSLLADQIIKWPGAQLILGPLLKELTTRHQQTKNKEIPNNIKVISIAGTKNFLPGVSKIMKTQHDGMVGLPHTQLPRMDDHIIVPESHLSLLTSKQVMAICQEHIEKNIY